jgi:hypothetical protein
MGSAYGTDLPGALPRPRFEPGHYLAAGDLHTEQRYRLQRARRHNRFLHGWGVVCGLLVTPAREVGQPWAVRVCPGYAIGPYGDEIEVRAAVRVDLRDHLWHRPVVGATRLAFVGVRYEEVPGRPVPTSPPGCGCADPRHVPSRVGDGYRAEARWGVGLPEAESIDVCQPAVTPCPDCPESPWVWLARVLLPLSEADPISPQQIDNWTWRRHLRSTAQIQAQLLHCCCDTPAGSTG